MSNPVTLPLWLVVLLGALALWSLLERLLVPSVRWYLRRRVNRVIDELNTRLSIRLQPFKLTRRRVLVDRLTYDAQVLETLDRHVAETGMPREVALAEVETYAKEIVPSFNAYVYFRVGYWLSRKVAQLTYRVRLGYSDESALQRIDPRATVVFVMNHRSNMDYVLVSYLAASQTALSYAVGEWARIWGLQQLIRSMGAYFVRRRSRNPLYRKVLERYVQMATESGVTQAIFPEGGLSRDGRLRPPRMGILGYMLRTFDPRVSRDIVFVPVGINYDRTLEDRTLLLSQDEGAPKKGRLAAARTTLRFLAHNLLLVARQEWRRFGYACVNFGTPLSLTRYLSEHGGGALPGSDAHNATVERLATELMGAVGRVIPVVPVALVASVFAARPEDHLSEGELQYRAHLLVGALEDAGARVYVPRRDRAYAIQVGLRMLLLRHLIEERDGLFGARVEELAVLRYYANSVAHFLE